MIWHWVNAQNSGRDPQQSRANSAHVAENARRFDEGLTAPLSTLLYMPSETRRFRRTFGRRILVA
jgi:hypothetical protein